MRLADKSFTSETSSLTWSVMFSIPVFTSLAKNQPVLGIQIVETMQNEDVSRKYLFQ